MTLANSSVVLPLVCCSLAIEVCFYLVFHLVLVRRANRIAEHPEPYRDYPPSERHQLVLRILRRFQSHHHPDSPEQLQQDLRTFLFKWFVLQDKEEEEEQMQQSPATLVFNEEASSVVATEDSSSLSSSSSSLNRNNSSIHNNTSNETSTSTTAILRSNSLLLRALNHNPQQRYPTSQDDDACSAASSSSSASAAATSTPNTAATPTAPTTDLWTIPELDKEQVDDFLAWAFFGKHLEHLVDWELDELSTIYRLIRDQVGLEFFTTTTTSTDASATSTTPLRKSSDSTSKSKKSTSIYRARKMTLEPVQVWHRPLALYLAVALMRWAVGFCLTTCLGFSRLVSPSTGLVAWYRPATAATTTSTARRRTNQQPRQQEQQHLLPLLFFHGIAPGGHVLYLPMVLWGLAGDGRAVVVFENPSISCCVMSSLRGLFTDAPLDERQTTRGVLEILHQTEDSSLANMHAPLALAGHSFGSVPLTWLLHDAAFQKRIRQVTLLDPVTLLLSEPDVMTNFLFNGGGGGGSSSSTRDTDAEEEENEDCTNEGGLWQRLRGRPFVKNNTNLIRMVASSELFVQWYLRRHFAWYNAELWMEDVPPHVQLVVALSEHDQILNAPKVKQELDRHATNSVHHKNQKYHNNNNNNNHSVNTNEHDNNPAVVLYWKHVGHAHCVTSPSKWKQLKAAMLLQEEQILQQLPLQQAAEGKKQL